MIFIIMDFGDFAKIMLRFIFHFLNNYSTKLVILKLLSKNFWHFFIKKQKALKSGLFVCIATV